MIEESAPAKVNLVLHVGPRRPDGLHDLCSLFASLELADSIAVEPRPGSGHGDEVLCPGVEGPNLAAAALTAFRAAAPGAELPPLSVRIDKRIPVAAGLGGGSADAAAVLRAANRFAGEPLDAGALRAIGLTLGADVPSQVEPRHALVTGAGEGVEPVELPDMALLLVPSREGLATGAVYAEADRIGSTRARLAPAAVRALAGAPLAALANAMANDLEAAALSLRPELARTLAQLEEAGALAARISGSGPTAFGVYESSAEAESAAAALASDAIVTPLRLPVR
ncbi:MAG: 4-diphosphocytidyl-2-C-methyl-D-erythritol kinase [Thermoleophilaceae bacterium]|jgi:4-diphosphocytidyl-2-C-methyl-D-erythritol kinase|nr:4-diphosphocytidyl-2-C-methyl-D-erythritol kinase [Thermoleophilaceae bacterium]